MKEAILIVIIAVISGIVLGVTISPPTTDAEPINQEYKIFEDGVTHKLVERFGGDEIPYIIHNGQEYKCVGTGYHLTPVCVEIIMRSIP